MAGGIKGYRIKGMMREIRKLFPQRPGVRGVGGMDGVSPEGAARIQPRVKP